MLQKFLDEMKHTTRDCRNIFILISPNSTSRSFKILGKLKNSSQIKFAPRKLFKFPPKSI